VFDFAKKETIITEDDSEIGNIAIIKPEVLLFQTGYLTIRDNISEIEESPEYLLDLPNIEVAKALGPFLLESSYRRITKQPRLYPKRP
jgi:hypothetical protein